MYTNAINWGDNMDKRFVRRFVRSYDIKHKPMRERIDCLVDFLNFICKYESPYEIINVSYDSQFDVITLKMTHIDGSTYDLKNMDLMKNFITFIMSYFDLRYNSCSYGLVTRTTETERQFTVGLIREK